MSNQKNDEMAEITTKEKSSNDSLNGLMAKLKTPYTITLPVWVYGLVALIAVALILD